MEQAGGNGAGDGGAEGGRDPDFGIADDVTHLQHGGTQTLADEAAPAVFPEGQHGKAHHLGAAASHGSTAGEARQAKRGADGSGGNGQGQCHAHDHGYENAHPEGLQNGGPLHEFTHGGSGGADGGGNEGGKAHTHQNGHQGGYQNVHLGFFGNSLAAFRSHNGDDQHGQRTAGTGGTGESGAAQGIGGVTHGSQGEQHQGRCLKGEADGDRHSRTAHGRTVGTHLDQKVQSQLLAQCLDNGADEQ